MVSPTHMHLESCCDALSSDIDLRSSELMESEELLSVLLRVSCLVLAQLLIRETLKSASF